MLGVIVCSAALAWSLPATSSPPVTYAEARAKAGRSPDDQVRLALWCEAHGLTSERLHHLTLAVLADPNHAAARGLLGLVSHDGRWLRPEVVADRLKLDPSLVEYESRRLATPETADGHWTLGVWAGEHGLPDQASAHFTAVTRLDPSRADAWKRLGYKKQDGRWITEEQVLAARAETEAQRQADRKWKPFLEECRRWIATPSRHDEGEAMLLEVTDPRAVPSIVRVFAATEALQPRAVRLLGQVDAPESSRSLAYLAVYARSAEARRGATETLRTRDPREYAEILIALLGEPIRFEVKHVDGPNSPGELLVEGRRANLRRVYTPPTVFRPDDELGFDDSGRAVLVRNVGPSTSMMSMMGVAAGLPLPPGRLSGVARSGVTPSEAVLASLIIGPTLQGQAIGPWSAFAIHFGGKATIPLDRVATEARKSAVATERQLVEDARVLEDHNVAVRLGNDRVAGVLNDATGQRLPADRRAWTTWWVDRIGYATPSSDWTSRDSTVEDISIAYQPPLMPDGTTRQIVGYDRQSCFGAGTPIRTSTGPRAIESLRVGDRVLSQHMGTGALGYRAVLKVHHNPPSPTFRIKLAGQPIVSSPFHRFWVAGQGWAMARDLKPGDPIRTLGGVSPVESVEADAAQPVYNLDVADDADFFAGSVAALVHDNTLPDPRLAPFDRARAR